MARQRLSIGTFGDISTRMSSSGRYLARTRYRDWDGHARLVQANGTTAKAAERALRSKLADRDLFQPADTTLTPDSLFSDLVTYRVEDIDLEGRISRTIRNLYERNMRTLVSPVFDSLTLREIGVARCDKFIKQLSKNQVLICHTSRSGRPCDQLAEHDLPNVRSCTSEGPLPRECHATFLKDAGLPGVPC